MHKNKICANSKDSERAVDLRVSFPRALTVRTTVSMCWDLFMQAVFTGGAQPPCNASAAHVPESNWSYPVGQTFRLPNLMMVRKAMASLRMSFPAQLPHTYVPISSACSQVNIGSQLKFGPSGSCEDNGISAWQYVPGWRRGII